MFRHARLVHIVFSTWQTTASPSAVNLTEASGLEEDRDRVENVAHARRLLRYDRSAPSSMNG